MTAAEQKASEAEMAAAGIKVVTKLGTGTITLLKKRRRS